ncbi:hypothetical protein FD09_GL002908 [Schleiferilactobacillus perolens DSM 12744]|uniref:ATPase AAA-type core domain-containing protein n=1 Tax=Schleiferilactobacillus perolens DSM 12744 TaxID=1423792 RepID=A0A0R1MXI1_9LACO|nr:hypothetical protein FD09_GL002908 [Schleiferilactobacillus perolens DSM 12744]
MWSVLVEFDVLAKVRDDQNEMGELKRVVNSLIQNMDAFDPSSILIAATNHPQLLDSAIWRRFDATLKLTFPDVGVRKQLLQYFMKMFQNNFQSERKKVNRLVEDL